MKRKLVFVLLFSIILVLSGCSNDEKVVLNVFNWGDYIEPSVLESFTEETGIEVNYETYPSNEDMYLKIKSGGTQYDVIFPSDYMLEKMAKEDLLEKIDLTKIPNFEHIGEDFKNPKYDLNNDYSVPYTWGTVGIMYNTEMVDETVDSWDILWDEKYAGQILMYDSQRDSMMVALKKLGYSMNTKNIDELNEARDLLIEQKPIVLAYAGDDGKGMIEQGEAAMFVTYSGDAMEIIDSYDHIEYALPKEGTNIWYDCLAIPKNSENIEAAHEFINYMSRPDIALKNFEYLLYSTANVTALESIDKAYLEMDAINPDISKLDNSEVFRDPGTFIEEFNRVWTEVKAAN
ncbi:MAG TPA: spermidine/putrescine ABC transporter substrate-binding protein [Clostridia bacterium]|nr:spermidine/putrescine ABC transporter substrate-binding protein [Clostridia bacterium]